MIASCKAPRSSTWRKTPATARSSWQTESAESGALKPSPRSVAAARELSRSGTSFKNSAMTKPARATGTTQLKTWVTAPANASTIGVLGRRQVGQRGRALCRLGRDAGRGQSSPRSGSRRLVYSAPKTAVPKEPPIVRKNVTPEVAVPSWA